MAMFGGGNVLAKLGVRPVINAQGNLTTLGGSTSPVEIRAAMDEANEHWYEMEELFEKSGEFIAGVLGTESAYVTSGCAAAQTLSTAACMAGDDPDKIGQLPDTTGMKNEFLIQKAQRYGFDRCFTLAGGKLVEVGNDEGCTAEELAGAIGPRTAAIAYPVQTDWGTSVLPLDAAVRVAHENDVPVIADAASQIYPLDYFQRSAQGADLVCFGAKYFGAPHSSGIVTGRRGLVSSVVRQGFIAYQVEGQRAFGRPMKLDREEIVGAVAALDRWFSMNHEDRFAEYERKASVIQAGLAGVSNATTEVVAHDRFFKQTLHVTLSPALGKTAQQVADELDAGTPRIWVGVQGEDTITLNMHVLNDGEEDIVATRLKDALTA